MIAPGFEPGHVETIARVRDLITPNSRKMTKMATHI